MWPWSRQEPPPQAQRAAGHGARPGPTALAALGDALRALDATCAGLQLPAPYAQRARVERDVGGACELFAGLRPGLAPLHGWPHALLALLGTIPIEHAGGRYNIPVTIYVLPCYPQPHGAQAPVLALVTPTAQMTLHPRHARLDAGGHGQCLLAALSSWHAAQSSLLGVVSEMAAEFSQDPPVYALPPGAVPAVAYPAAGTLIQPAASAGGDARGRRGRGDAAEELAQELSDGRRAFLAEQLRGRAAQLHGAHERRCAQLRAQRQALQARAVAIVEADAACARERAELERERLERSAARGALEEWAAAHGEALGAAGGAPGAASLGALIAPADARAAKVLAAHAEERALRDGLGVVASMHAAGSIPPDVFLRQTRELARALYFALAERRELDDEGLTG